MKQKIVALVLGCACVLGTYLLSKNASEKSVYLLQEFELENVEALASSSESGSSDSWSCWSDLKDGYGVWVCGNPCTFLYTRNAKNPSRPDGVCVK